MTTTMLRDILRQTNPHALLFMSTLPSFPVVDTSFLFGYSFVFCAPWTVDLPDKLPPFVNPTLLFLLQCAILSLCGHLCPDTAYTTYPPYPPSIPVTAADSPEHAWTVVPLPSSYCSVTPTFRNLP